MNVASRMDYTGVLGKIQCPDEVAECLERDGVSCTFRDVIFVKGKGNMRTHFVDLNKDTHIMSTTDGHVTDRCAPFRNLRMLLYLWPRLFSLFH